MTAVNTARCISQRVPLTVPARAGRQNYARADNAIWDADPTVRVALACLEEILQGPSPFIVRGLLQPGTGLVGDNVLYDRAPPSPTT